MSLDTYTFKITEQSGSTLNDGYTYDKAEWTLTVVVDDDQNGKLSINEEQTKYSSDKADVSDNITSAEFTNKYMPASTTTRLEVSKVVEGAPMAKEEEFTFTQSLVNETDGVSLPKNNQVTIKVQPSNAGNEQQNRAKFNPITFTKAGTYKFYITEDTSKLPDGYDKSISNIKLVEVTVEDAGGSLRVTRTKYYTSTDSTEQQRAMQPLQTGIIPWILSLHRR